MEILRSILRIFGGRPEDEEVAGLYHASLLRRRQNPTADSSVRLPKIGKLCFSICNGVKLLLHTLGSFLRFPRLKRSSDRHHPLLPIQAPSASNQVVVVTVVAPTSTADQEIVSSAVSEDEDDRGTEEDEEKEDEEEEEEEERAMIESIFRWPKRSADRRHPSLPIQAPAPIPETTPSVSDHVVVTVAPHTGAEIVSSAVLVDEDDRRTEMESILGVPPNGRRIRHYSSRQRILVVGDGDFSFSASLAVAFGSASNIVATSLDSREFLKNNYSRALSNIEKLRGRSSMVIHKIDATKMANHSLLGHLKFDRIIFNFPYAGLQNVKNLKRESQLRCHRRLVQLFLKNARDMISEDGEIHITHKTNCFHLEFHLELLAFSLGLGLIEAVRFNRLDYPGYGTKYGFGGDNNFNCYPSKTYRFGLHKLQS